MNKIKLKIFLTFFLISSFFAYWTSWNEETNFLLTKEIVGNKDFYLDKYHKLTGDIFYNFLFSLVN
jgi:hypothetical protein